MWGTSGLASAADGDQYACGGNFCGWVNEVYNGPRYVTNTQQPNLTLNGRPECPQRTWNDCMSSLFNQTSYEYFVWSNIGNQGARGFVEAGAFGGTNGAGQPSGTRRTLTNADERTGGRVPARLLE